MVGGTTLFLVIGLSEGSAKTRDKMNEELKLIPEK